MMSVLKQTMHILNITSGRNKIQKYALCKRCFSSLQKYVGQLRDINITPLVKLNSVQNTYENTFVRTSNSSDYSTYHQKKIAEDTRMYNNPMLDLKQYLEVPLLGENEHTFSPSREEMDEAKLLFRSSGSKHKIKFLRSAIQMDTIQDVLLPEVAFIGRSNVGKSSLIQALFNEVPEVVVKVSKKPGCTKTLNLFQVGNAFTLVDMPGYGFNMPDHFQNSVETYLQTRRNLCRTFLLVDATVGITSIDRIGLKMLEDFKIPYVLVMTKIDKAKKHVLLKNLLAAKKIREESPDLCCFPQPFFVSSLTEDGLLLLKAFVGYISGNLYVKGV